MDSFEEYSMSMKIRSEGLEASSSVCLSSPISLIFSDHIVLRLKTYHEASKAIAIRMIGINTVCQKRKEEKPIANHSIIRANHFILDSIARFSS